MKDVGAILSVVGHLEAFSAPFVAECHARDRPLMSDGPMMEINLLMA